MPRKPSAKKVAKAVQGLLAALKFIEPSQSEIGQINQTHCALGGNWVVGFNGLIMMAAKIDTDIVAFPNTKRLINVLSKCDTAVQITQIDGGRLGVKSGKFNAFVPCIEGGLLAFTPPDPPQIPITEDVLKSLAVVGIIAKENAPRMVQASVMLRNNSAVATDGVMAFEFWHGVALPGSLTLPKAFLSELGKITKKPVALGASASTCTIHFEDESFIRTQLYTDPYPDVDRVLNAPNSPFPIPAEFWTALEKIDSMKDENNNVYFNAKGTKLQTTADENVGASFEYESPMPDGIMFNIDLLRRFAPYAKQGDFVAGDRKDMAVLYGDNFRGVLMQKRITKEPTAQPLTPATSLAAGYTPADINPDFGTPGKRTDLDDEIPF